jgi:hypothetical protein
MSTAASENGYFDNEVMKNIVDMAFDVNDQCAELCCEEHRSQFIRALINDAEVVWCVWPDEQDESAYHGTVIKGAGRAGLLETTAFLVANRRTADLARDTLGDGAPVVTHDMPGAIQ